MKPAVSESLLIGPPGVSTTSKLCPSIICFGFLVLDAKFSCSLFFFFPLDVLGFCPRCFSPFHMPLMSSYSVPTPPVGIVGAVPVPCGDMGLPTMVENGSLSLYTLCRLVVPPIAVLSRTEDVITSKSTLLFHFLLLVFLPFPVHC